jgi:hypothetical protein
MNSKPRQAPPGGVSAVAHTLTANDAATLTLSVAEHQAGNDDLNERHRLWPHIEGWAAELGLTGSDAVNRFSQPGAPGRYHDREGKRPDPEAGQ